MHVTMLLCESAQEINGKLYILGGGWSVTGPGPFQWALAVRVEVPWDEANVRKKVRLFLHDADGHAVMLPGTQTPIELNAELEVGRPAGMPRGIPIDTAFAVQGMPLVLPSGRYVWRLAIGEREDDLWQVGFYVRPPHDRVEGVSSTR